MKKIKLNKDKFGLNILMMSLTVAGIFSLTGGAVLNKMEVKRPHTYDIKVVEKRVAKQKSNVPVLKEVEVEIDVPISINVSDYITNLDDIDSNLLKKFKLDTSLVNVSASGTYTYTISYKDKKYNGTVVVKEKELPIINNMTLKDISLELGSKLPENLNDYIVETIPEEAKDKIIIDVSKVNTNMVGTYQYTVTYNEKLYTGNITIYESQPQIITPIITNKDDTTTKDTNPDSGSNNDASNTNKDNSVTVTP